MKRHFSGVKKSQNHAPPKIFLPDNQSEEKKFSKFSEILKNIKKKVIPLHSPKGRCENREKGNI